MPVYEIHAFCNDIGCGPHKVPIGPFTMDNGPTEKISLADLGHGQQLPSHVISLMNNSFTCPVTGRLFLQRDNRQIFIVPIGGSWP